MTYDEFKIAYTNAFHQMMKYHPNEIGSSVFAEKMAVLSDEYPDFIEQIEKESKCLT